jgi:hypothetical protein
LCLVLASHAWAEIGVVTLVDGGARLLRGPTWYKLATGVRVDDSDIVDVSERGQAQLEFATGTIVNLVGPGQLYLGPAAAKGGAPVATLAAGWLKAVAKAPGLRIRMPPFDTLVTEGIVVARADGALAAVFVESKTAKLVELAPNGSDGASREAKAGDYWSKSVGAALATAQSPPKAFVGAMPRHFVDALPALAAKTKGKPALVAERDITYAEAAPWLVGRDRIAFEKRFASRLGDPAFRRSAEPDLSRHPSWDRILHPEKYAPKDKPVPKDKPAP